MAITQARSRRTSTGSRYRDFRAKKKFECGNSAVKTKIGEKRSKKVRVLGGNDKVFLLKADTINLIDTKTKKSMQAKINNVIDNPANRNFIRANILTKGTVVETDKGKAKITNRPSQEGTVNGILV